MSPAVRQAIQRLMPPALRNWTKASLQRLRTARAKSAVAQFRPVAARPHGLPGPLVVSLTSYPPRFATLASTLKSLLMQKVRPDRLVLWVATEDMKFLPEDVRTLEDRGLEIRASKDLRSFKKFVPTMQTWPEPYVVICDDDLYYGPSWLEILVEGARTAPGAIVCRRAHRPLWRGPVMLPYSAWQQDIVTGGKIEGMIMPTGCGGILFPPGSLAPETCDSETFLALCPTADDVWLFVMALLAGTRFRQVGPGFVQICWDGSQDVSLMQANLAGDGNDRQLKAVIEHFGAYSLLQHDRS